MLKFKLKTLIKEQLNKTKNREKGATGENHWSWKGGKSQYPNHTEMKKNRKIKLGITGGKCEDCGKKEKIMQIHHIDLSKINHKLNNLKLLCLKCHCKYHLNRGRPRLYSNARCLKTGCRRKVVVKNLCRKHYNNILMPV